MMSTDDDLSAILEESLESAIQRERETFDRLTQPFRSIVLAGAGGLGRKVLAGLEQQGIAVTAFADNNERLWGTRIEGVEVFAPREAAARFGTLAAFVVSIWGSYSSHNIVDALRQLEELGCERATHFAHLFWKYPATFLPYYCHDLPSNLIRQSANIQAAYRLLADEKSRQTFVAQLHLYGYADFDAPRPASGAEYFPDLFELLSDEVFIDCGAFDGDTIRALDRRSKFAQAVALEPDPANFAKLRASVAEMKCASRVQTLPFAVAASSGKVSFEATGTMGARIGTGTEVVETVALDQLLVGRRPTYIKMDIEGAEPDALAGARRLIQQHLPVLAISAYHLQDHLWTIPRIIHSFSDQYRVYLRSYDQQGFGLCCYGVPIGRLK